MGHIYKELNKETIKNFPDYYPKRLVVEFCENIHLHYRNIRIEFSHAEFCTFWRCVNKSFKSFQKYLLNNIASLQEINIHQIDPFDKGHKQNGNSFDCGKEQQLHKEGIEYIKKLIQQKKKIRPIVVQYRKDQNKYKRMDGFKRYWAFKELGIQKIKCYVLKEYIAGIQEGMSLIIDEDS